jgi:predicted O-linked N-acetylglucosamine transferase (SPINDLY family)
MTSADPRFQFAVHRFRAQAFDEAERACHELLTAEPNDGDTLHLLGMVLCQAGRGAEGLESLRRAMQILPRDASLANNLGEACRRQQHLAEAVGWFQRASELAPKFAEPQYNLGVTLRAQGQHPEAIAAFRRAIDLRPDYARAQFNLGNALGDRGELEASLQAYRQAVRHDPRFAAGFTNLAHLLARMGREGEALETFRQAVAVAPHDPETHGNLAAALMKAGHFAEAEKHYHCAVSQAPDTAKWHLGLGDALRDERAWKPAEAAYREALKREPEMVAALHGLGVLALEQGRYAEAAEQFQRTLALEPTDESSQRNAALALETCGQTEAALTLYRQLSKADSGDELLRLHTETLCPLFPRDNAEIDAYRVRVLEAIEQYPPGRLQLPLRDVTITRCHAPFPWPYQGRDDRELKARWAGMFAHCFPDGSPNRNAGKPRVGFVVTAGHESIFIRSMRGILERWPKHKWRLTIVCSGPSGQRELRAGLSQAEVDYLPLPPHFDRAIEVLRDARFDLLYYWEVATDAINYFLPFCRLAPVQCTSWGWQVTTGIPRLDYYISARPVEPADAQAQYTERLHLLDSLPTCYARPQVPAKPPARETWCLRADQHVYFCAQNLLKVHPDFDALVATILRRDPAGIAVFVAGRHRDRAEVLRQRWQQTIPDVNDRLLILADLAQHDYLGLMRAADVSIDTLHYGGVNTTYDAMAAGTPVVTLPGSWQRARYTQAVYRHLGVLDCIAESVDHYVDLALRLTAEPDFRHDVSRRITAASPTLFDQQSPVTELAACFEQLLAAAE